MKKTNKKGFTIVELVIVIAVIAILSAVLIPTFAGVTTDAKMNAAKANARNAYIQLVADNPHVDVDNDQIYYDAANGYFVAIKDGKVVGAYTLLADAETAANIDVAAPATDAPSGFLN